MINLHKSGTTNTISIYPESGSIYYSSPSGSFSLELTQDYDQNVTEVSATLINTPTEFNPRLTLQISSSAIPSYSGLYTVKVNEYVALRPKWGNTHTKWFDAHWQWSQTQAVGNKRILDTDRAFVSGSDTPVFTQYASPDETGAYITYNN